MSQSAVTEHRLSKESVARVELAEPPRLNYSTTNEDFAVLAEAALDERTINGWTHKFYRYPARFAPGFAATAIARFSKKGDLILDPYMGGGTAVVEGVVAGRHVVGNDLNSLAVFITRVKTTELNRGEVQALHHWAASKVSSFSYRWPTWELIGLVDDEKTRNLTLVRGRFIKKLITVALASIAELPTRDAQNLARCALLRVAQWALDGRQRQTTLHEFRSKLASTTIEMVAAIASFAAKAREAGGRATLSNADAAKLDQLWPFRDAARRASLVITSPPYPGVHVLYHRWQVDGRRETPAPYWIAGCNDGNGASYYNFGSRQERAADKYFRTSLDTLHSIRRVIREDGYFVQIIAFRDPPEQLPRYLENMRAAGFAELTPPAGQNRTWRNVPNRRWHAAIKGNTSAANEVVLVHRPV